MNWSQKLTAMSANCFRGTTRIPRRVGTIETTRAGASGGKMLGAQPGFHFSNCTAVNHHPGPFLYGLTKENVQHVWDV